MKKLKETGEKLYHFIYQSDNSSKDALICNNAESWKVKADALYTLGRKQEATEAYDQAISYKFNLDISSNQDYAKAYFNKGYALYNRPLRRYEEAIEVFDLAIKYNPDYKVAYMLKGQCLHALGRCVEAMEIWSLSDSLEAIENSNKAIMLKSNDVKAHDRKGFALKELGRYQEAIDAFKQVIKYKPDYGEVYYGMGNALKALGRYEEAIEAYDQAIKFKTDYHDNDAYNEKGLALERLGKYEEAIKVYEQAIILEPKYNDAYTNKAFALEALGRYQEAIDSLDLDPQHSTYKNHHNKGVILAAAGRNEEAIEAYDQAGSILSYCNKGKVLNKLGREQEALECFNKAFEMSKKYPLSNIYYDNSISYIKNTLSHDREVLLQKLTKLQETTEETQKMVDSLDQTNPAAKKIIDKLGTLRKSKILVITEILKEFEKDIKENTSNQQIREALTQMTQMQTQMEALQKEVKELKEHKIQTDKRLDTLEEFQSAVEKMQKAVDIKISSTVQDKEKMQQQINDIVRKTKNFANQDDVEKITNEMKNLITENQVTDDRLKFLEKDVDAIIEKQANQGSNTASTKVCIVEDLVDKAISNENAEGGELILNGLISLMGITEAPTG